MERFLFVSFGFLNLICYAKKSILSGNYISKVGSIVYTTLLMGKLRPNEVI